MDYTVATLTPWGMAEIKQNYQTLGGSMLYRLIHRAFPKWFKDQFGVRHAANVPTEYEREDLQGTWGLRINTAWTRQHRLQRGQH